MPDLRARLDNVMVTGLVAGPVFAGVILLGCIWLHILEWFAPKSGIDLCPPKQPQKDKGA